MGEPSEIRCPEPGCGANANRPKCLFELGGDCPRHEALSEAKATMHTPVPPHAAIQETERHALMHVADDARLWRSHVSESGDDCVDTPAATLDEIDLVESLVQTSLPHAAETLAAVENRYQMSQAVISVMQPVIDAAMDWRQNGIDDSKYITLCQAIDTYSTLLPPADHIGDANKMGTPPHAAGEEAPLSGDPYIRDVQLAMRRGREVNWIKDKAAQEDNAMVSAGSPSPAASQVGEDDRIYPCDVCGRMRTKAEGGASFAVCDTCWDKCYPRLPASSQVAPEMPKWVAKTIARIDAKGAEHKWEFEEVVIWLADDRHRLADRVAELEREVEEGKHTIRTLQTGITSLGRTSYEKEQQILALQASVAQETERQGLIRDHLRAELQDAQNKIASLSRPVEGA